MWLLTMAVAVESKTVDRPACIAAIDRGSDLWWKEPE